jgi:hypothetical protein
MAQAIATLESLTQFYARIQGIPQYKPVAKSKPQSIGFWDFYKPQGET